MKIRAFPMILVAPLLLVAAVASAAQSSAPASQEDLAKLQADLANLEADLADAPSLSDEVAARIDAIRDEAIYLKVKMRKHDESGGEGTGVSRNGVRDLRLEIADLRDELRPILARSAPAPRQVIVPAGTELDVRLEDTLTSETASPGDRFTATAVAPVVAGNAVAIEAGTIFRGVVELVDQAGGRTDRTARLVLVVDRVELGGTTREVSATVLKASEKLQTGLGSETKKIGIGAGLGTVLGAVLGGKTGAVVGAVAGGTGAVLATEGKEVELPRGTILHLRLDADLAVTAPN